jgi:mannosyltransferase OCH1-like enzyme
MSDFLADYPVWMYWEGARPRWIAECHKTTFAHLGKGVRLLSPESFDKLWKSDRDIELERLIVPHRADFIRVYLLAQYGGLWIDSDCIIMRPLQPLFMSCLNEGPIGYRDRHGRIANNFIAARQGCRVLTELHNLNCKRIRAEIPLNWSDLGSAPLTQLIDNSSLPWNQVAYEFIEPVCWNNPETFFKRADDEEHERHINPAAFTYMLSNQTMKNYCSENFEEDLLIKDSFFSFLLRTSSRGRS